MKIQHKILAKGYFLFKLYRWLKAFLNSKKNDSLRVIVYHDVTSDEFSKIEKQLIWLQKHWTFITPEQFNNYRSGKIKLTGQNLLLTFDDGFASNFLVAQRILDHLGIKAIFFVVSEFVKQTNITHSHKFIAENIRADLLPSDMENTFQNMSWSNLRDLLEMGHTIGAHTKTHPRLTDISTKKELTDEIVNSANILEDQLGVSISDFAFTFGDALSINDESLQISKLRFKNVYTSLRGNNIFNLQIDIICRDTLNPNDSLSLIGSFLYGAVDFLYKKSICLLRK